ncbi:MAG TPA: hypothetical protein VFS13_19690, partial [Steroidobacteraceae bacterium]|nr:hypothetical protein [Steroidobacteraceae bacterium]
MLARFAAFVTLIVGVFVLTGWMLDMEQLTNLVPGWPRMVKLSAVAFVVSAASLWFASTGAVKYSAATGALVAAIGMLVLVAQGGYWNVYLDQLSLREIPVAIDGMPPPSMAPATALAFLLLGISLAVAASRRYAPLHQALATAVLLLGWVGLSRFVFGGDVPFPMAEMAAHTA